MSESQMRRLLGAHAAVLNALTNPELDSEWKSSRSTPGSVLAMSDDDWDPEALVIVSSVMSDDSDDNASLCDTFVMPRLNMSTTRALRITVLSETAYQHDTAALIDYVRDSSGRTLDINHVSLSTMAPIDDTLIRESDLLFIVNDGSFVFVDYLRRVLGKQHIDGSDDDDDLPKLTVINMMTVNYFINLFELITSLRPYQIWKTSSLKHRNLLDKVRNFIEVEADNMDPTALSTTNRSMSLTVSDRSRSIYSSLISTKKPNYKQLEKQFKSELAVDSSIIDPLALNKNFAFLRHGWAVLKGCFPADPAATSNHRLYVAVSFAMGISLGIGIAGGLAIVVHMYVTRGINNLLASSAVAAPPKVHRVPQELHPVSILTRIGDIVTEFCSDSVQNISKNDAYVQLAKSCSSVVEGLRSTSAFVVECVRGGLEKVVGFILYSSH